MSENKQPPPSYQPPGQLPGQYPPPGGQYPPPGGQYPPPGGQYPPPGGQYPPPAAQYPPPQQQQQQVCHLKLHYILLFMCAIDCILKKPVKK